MKLDSRFSPLGRRIKSGSFCPAVYMASLIICSLMSSGRISPAAAFAGRAFGKHKLCPVVSPKKTVEGAIGGVLGTMVFGVVATIIYSMAANRMEAFTRSNIGVSMYFIIALLGRKAVDLVPLGADDIQTLGTDGAGRTQQRYFFRHDSFLLCIRRRTRR